MALEVVQNRPSERKELAIKAWHKYIYTDKSAISKKVHD